MAAIIEFSDSHENPEEMSQQLREIIELAKSENANLLVNGDFLNLLPWGYDKWVRCVFMGELNEALGGHKLWLISGNHDPYPWLKRLFSGWPNIRISRFMLWAAPCGQIEFRHGHRWSPDWRVLRYFAPGFVEFMADHFPKQWYWFSRKMDWIPSNLKEEAEPGTEKERDYRLAILSVWYGAVGHAHRKNRIVICGHTHSQGSLNAEKETLVADGGTLKEGEFIRVDREIELCKL